MRKTLILPVLLFFIVLTFTPGNALTLEQVKNWMSNNCQLIDHKQFVQVGHEHYSILMCNTSTLPQDYTIDFCNYLETHQLASKIVKKAHELGVTVSAKVFDLDYQPMTDWVSLSCEETVRQDRIYWLKFSWIRNNDEDVDWQIFNITKWAVWSPAINTIGAWTGCIAQGSTISGSQLLCHNFTDSEGYESNYRVEYPNGTVFMDWTLLAGGQHILELDTDCNSGGICNNVKPAISFTYSENVTWTGEDTTNSSSYDNKTGFQVAGYSWLFDGDGWYIARIGTPEEVVDYSNWNFTYTPRIPDDNWLMDFWGYNPSGTYHDYFKASNPGSGAWADVPILGSSGTWYDADYSMSTTSGQFEFYWKVNQTDAGDFDHYIDAVRIHNPVGGAGNWTNMSFDTTAFPDGEWVVRFNASHFANYSEANLTLTLNFTIDNNPPSGSFNYPPDFTGLCGVSSCGYVDTTIRINVTVTDTGTGVDTVWCMLDGVISDFGNYTLIQDGATDYYYNDTTVTNDIYTVLCWANDSAGSTSSINRGMTVKWYGLDAGQNATLYGLNNITQELWDYMMQNYNLINETDCSNMINLQDIADIVWNGTHINQTTLHFNAIQINETTWQINYTLIDTLADMNTTIMTYLYYINSTMLTVCPGVTSSSSGDVFDWARPDLDGDGVTLDAGAKSIIDVWVENQWVILIVIAIIILAVCVALYLHFRKKERRRERESW